MADESQDTGRLLGRPLDTSRLLGRPPRVPTLEDVDDIYLKLLTVGIPIMQAAKIVGRSHTYWLRRSRADADFAARRAKAIGEGPGLLTALAAETLRREIANGNSWWTRLAICNGLVKLIDPDAEIAALQADARPNITVVISREAARRAKLANLDNEPPLRLLDAET